MHHRPKEVEQQHVLSPMTGRIISVAVKPGDKVYVETFVMQMVVLIMVMLLLGYPRERDCHRGGNENAKRASGSASGHGPERQSRARGAGNEGPSPRRVLICFLLIFRYTSQSVFI